MSANVGFWERTGQDYRRAQGVEIAKSDVLRIEGTSRPRWIVTPTRRIAIEPELAQEMQEDLSSTGLKDEYDYKGVEW